MGLHIEIMGPLEPKEWEAVAALVAVMRGHDAPGARAVETVAQAPAPLKLGTDADRPLVNAPPASATVAAPPTPPASSTVADASSKPSSAAPPPPPPPPEGVTVDKAGLPWDGRIHASTKSVKADGTWTAKRGVHADEVTKVTAELKTAMAATGAPLVEPEQPHDAPVYTDPAQAFGAPAATTAPPPPPPEVVPAPPATDAPSADAAVTGIAEFARVMKVVLAKQAAGVLSTAMTTELVKTVGLPDIRSLASRPDLIPAFEAILP